MEPRLKQSRGDDGNIYVCYEGPDVYPMVDRLVAALRARAKFIEGQDVDPEDESLKQDALTLGLAYLRCMTELACWELVSRGELMIATTPAWAHGDKHRQPMFLTLDGKTIVINISSADIVN